MAAPSGPRPSVSADARTCIERFGISVDQFEQALWVQVAGSDGAEDTLAPAARERLVGLKGKPLAEILAALHGLPPERAAACEEALRGGDTTRVDPALRRTLPPGTAPSPPQPPPRLIDRYEVRGELGRGGMGVVTRAFDPQLKREVALKLLLAGEFAGEEERERFGREARAAAKLSHPNIVPIFDIGVHDGKPFFTMELVPGQSLAAVRRAAGGKLAPHEAMRLVREVAIGLAYAHAQGVIHRDLKPENIILEEPTASGAARRPRLLDFGLARVVEESSGTRRRTETGLLLGTPAYMAPEQAAGQVSEIDARSDVYALGAVLYELVVGRAAYEGVSPMGIVMRKLVEDPAPPRRLNPAIALDVETIVMKAMARERDRRYATATEMADDLGRCLAGEAIHARAEPTWERGARWVRRRRIPVGFAAAAVLALAAAGFSVLHARATAAEKEDLWRQVCTGLRDKTTLLVDFALTLRRNGLPVGAAAPFVDQLLPSVQDAERVDPSRAEPRYQLGRMYRAMQMRTEAFHAQEQALAKDPDYVPARYERAVLLCHAYSDRIECLRTKWARTEGYRLLQSGRLLEGGMGGVNSQPASSDRDLAAGDPRAREILVLLEEDLRHVRSASSRPGELPLAPAQVLCARGLQLAYTFASPEEAAQAALLLKDSLAMERTLEEAYEAWGKVLLSSGKPQEAIEVYSRGIEVDRGCVLFFRERAYLHSRIGRAQLADAQDPRDSFARAEKDLDRAIELDAKEAANWEQRGGVLGVLACCLEEQGEDPLDARRRAFVDLDRALQIDPGLAAAWTWHACVNANAGFWEDDRGADPEASFAKAEADFSRAIGIAADELETRKNRGIMHATWGMLRKSRGKPFEEILRGGEADLTRALELNPLIASTWVGRGRLHEHWGMCVGELGQDPAGQFGAADADYTKAIELDAGLADAWVSRARLHMEWGFRDMQYRADPTAHYTKAEADFAHALERWPGSVDAWRSRGELHIRWAFFLHQHGGDGIALLRQADEELTRATALAPRQANVWALRGEARLSLGTIRLTRGEDSGDTYAAAESDLTKALELSPGVSSNWQHRGELGRGIGQLHQAKGEDPGEAYARAEADLSRALTLNPLATSAWLERGMVRVNQARVREGKGEDPTSLDQAAEGDFAKAIEIEPYRADAWMNRGKARNNLAFAVGQQGKDPESWIRGAEADYGKAVELDAACEEAWSGRGWLRSFWGMVKSRHGEDGREVWTQGLADLTRAIELRPGDADLRWKRGRIEHSLGRWADAVADFEEAARTRPGCERNFQSEFDEARQMAKEAKKTK